MSSIPFYKLISEINWLCSSLHFWTYTHIFECLNPLYFCYSIPHLQMVEGKLKGIRKSAVQHGGRVISLSHQGSCGIALGNWWGWKIKKKKSLKTDQGDTNFYFQLALPSGWEPLHWGGSWETQSTWSRKSRALDVCHSNLASERRSWYVSGQGLKLVEVTGQEIKD